MKLTAVLLALFAALALALPALAQGGDPATQPPLVLTGEQGEYRLGRHMDILEDPGGMLTIDQVASPETAARFTPSLVDAPNFGYTRSAYWLRLRLRNEDLQNNLWLLEAHFPNLNYVDLYMPEEGGGYTVKHSGLLQPFSSRDYPYYHIVIGLPLQPGAEQTFYIRVVSGSSMTLAFSLWSPQAFGLQKLSDMLQTGLFYGALLILLVYQLYAFYSLREAVHLYFILFLASAILFIAAYEGLAGQYLWPAYTRYQHYFLVIFFGLFFISTLKFSDVFLEQKTRAPRLHRLTNIVAGLYGLLVGIGLFSGYGALAAAGVVILLGTPVFCTLISVVQWRKGFQPARFYLLSWLGLAVGLVLAGLVRINLLPSTPLTEYFYRYGLLWLALVWALALANRIHLLRAEAENASRRLQQSERQLSQTLEGLPLGVVVYGPDQKPAYINQRAADILANPGQGIVPDLNAGRTWLEAMRYFSFRLGGSEQPYPAERMPVGQAYGGVSAAVDDIEADLVDRRVPLEMWASPVRNQRGQVEAVVVAYRDISRRKAQDAELEQYRRELEEQVHQRTAQLGAEIAERSRLEDILRLRLVWLALVNQVNQAVSRLDDLPEAYQTFVGMIYRLFGAVGGFLAQADGGKRQLRLLAHACQMEPAPQLAGAALALPDSGPVGALFEQAAPLGLFRQELEALDEPFGDHFRAADCRLLMLIPLSNQVEQDGVIGLEFMDAERQFSEDEQTMFERICLDILQVRKKARLEQQNQELIATEERSRLARDLHDSVTQVLFSASLVAEVLPNIWRRDPKMGLASLEELRRLNRGALAEMRTLLLELRPAALLKTSLADLLAQLTEAVTSRSGLQFQMALEQIPALPDDVHIAFYRVAQESLNNVVKHAHASLVSVSLSAIPQPAGSGAERRGGAELMVRDNGSGIGAPPSGAPHLGLGIMRERAAAIHATLIMESQPGQGTTVRLTWPG